MRRVVWRALDVALTLLALAIVACAPNTGGEQSKAGTAPPAGDARDEADMKLIPAAAQGDVNTVTRLLDEGASVDARDEAGRTALVAAAYENRLEVAKVLIKAGADVNAKDETEQSAYLISTAEVGDDPRLLRLTLNNGANIGSLDSYNGTGLIRAADRGYVEVVEELLKTDIEVDHVNNLGWTALLEAIILGGGDAEHTEVVRLLVEAGADVNIADRDGVTPLEHARRRGYGAIIEILENAGAR
ncbi:MAG TPA: ankyrin repeat domain-containing protein [Rubrobacteraceae bacterium]|nr:ankyrin repeat domain-containing protein [Rubrobacteraceae bacterium]